MEDEVQVSKIKHRHKLSVDGIGGLGWVFFLGVIFLISFDGEIRCSLGNKAECAKMEVKAK